MTLSQMTIYIAVYILPALYLFGMACVVISQQPNRLENRLVASIVFIYSMLFLEEFFRHLVPISYSAIISKLFLGNLGLLVVGITFHLYTYLAFFQDSVKKSVYVYLFYVPFFIVVIALLFDVNLISNTEFVSEGIWYVPVFNLQYYFTITLGNVFIAGMFFILVAGYLKASLAHRKTLLRFLMISTAVVFLLNIVLGYTNFGENVPPYTYIYEGLIFSIFLSISVLRYGLLPDISKRYETLFNLSPIAILTVSSSWDILEINEYAKQQLRLHPKTTPNFMQFVQMKNNQSLLRKLAFDLQQNEIIHDYRMTFEMPRRRRVMHVAIDASVVQMKEDKIYYFMWRDVSEEVEKEKVIMHMAYHDTLTELHNRTYFVMKVRHKLAEMVRNEEGNAAIVLLDLNNFKGINDKYGHVVGDEVLRHAANLLKKLVRKSDIVARLGGDEFILFLPDYETDASVYEWTTRLRTMFATYSYESPSISVRVEPSIGIAFYGEDLQTFEELYHVADLKMYADKESVKNVIRG